MTLYISLIREWVPKSRSTAFLRSLRQPRRPTPRRMSRRSRRRPSCILQIKFNQTWSLAKIPTRSTNPSNPSNPALNQFNKLRLILSKMGQIINRLVNLILNSPMIIWRSSRLVLTATRINKAHMAYLT